MCLPVERARQVFLALLLLRPSAFSQRFIFLTNHLTYEKATMANTDDHDLPGLGFLSCSLSVVVYCSMREEPEVQETLGPVGCVVTCLKCEKRGGPGQPSPPPHERTPESIQLPGRLQLSLSTLPEPCCCISAPSAEEATIQPSSQHSASAQSREDLISSGPRQHWRAAWSLGIDSPANGLQEEGKRVPARVRGVGVAAGAAQLAERRSEDGGSGGMGRQQRIYSALHAA
ncbi:unnamed protein product [Gadus morhua 'NCC']